MKRITKSYQILCTCCAGSGIMLNAEFDPNVTATTQYKTCIVCGGNKTQTVTEITEER